MDAERFFREWCLSDEPTRHRLETLTAVLHPLSTDERGALTTALLDLAATYSSVGTPLLHNFYHTLRCLLTGIGHRRPFFVPTMRFVLYCCRNHHYLHDRLFRFFLRDVTSLDALEMLYGLPVSPTRDVFVQRLVRITGLDAERFYARWCLSPKPTRHRLRPLNRRLQKISPQGLAFLARRVLDRAVSTYFHPRFGAKTSVLHNVYHTLRALLARVEHKVSFFPTVLRLALNVRHCGFLHTRFFSLLLPEIGAEDALEALETLYHSSYFQDTEYVRALLPRLSCVSTSVRERCVMAVVNAWGDADTHEELLFHASVRPEQHRELLTGYVRALGTILEELEGEHHRRRFRRLLGLVDRLSVLAASMPENTGFSPALAERLVVAARRRAARAAMLEEIRRDVAYRPGNHGMEEAREDFLRHAEIFSCSPERCSAR